MAVNYTPQLPACGLTTEDVDEVVLKLRAEGRTYREIGNVLGICGSRARQRHLAAERRTGMSVSTPREIARRLEWQAMMDED